MKVNKKHADLMLGLVEGKKSSNIFIGLKNRVLDAMSGSQVSPLMTVSDAMAKDKANYLCYEN